jgi:hypothetical protein
MRAWSLRAIAVFVTGPLLALTLHAAGEIWVATEGLVPAASSPPDACSSEAFAAALHAQHPGLVVHAGDPARVASEGVLLCEPGREPPHPAPPARDSGAHAPDNVIEARLSRQGGVVSLTVVGAGIAVSRTLPASDPCERTVVTSALIVDGALDVLRVSTKAPHVDSLAPPVPFRKEVHFSVSLGAGAGEGTFGVVPAFALGAAARYRSFELTLDLDVGLPSQTTFTIVPPEATQSGTFSAFTGGAELGIMAAPRLGPGRIAAGVAFGLSLTNGSASSAGIFQQRGQSALEPFGALRVGYALDLPLGFFVGVRAEGRVNKVATFVVDGAAFAPPLGQDAVTTPIWTFQTLGLLGFHFS